MYEMQTITTADKGYLQWYGCRRKSMSAGLGCYLD